MHQVVGSTQYISTLMSALLVTGAFGQFCGPAFTTFFLTVSCDSPGCDCPVDTVCGCCKFNGINFCTPSYHKLARRPTTVPSLT